VLTDLRWRCAVASDRHFSISGTVIEQGQSVEFYQANYPEHPALFGFLTWKVLLTVGWDHVYHLVVLALLILFGTSNRLYLHPSVPSDCPQMEILRSTTPVPEVSSER